MPRKNFNPYPDYERPALAVDLALMSVVAGAPAALLLRRDAPPFAGQWSLPGGFVRLDEDLDGAARRLLHDKARMENVYLEQLYTFSAPNRDPRDRVIAVAYLALLDAERFAVALNASPDLCLAKISVDWTGETGGPAQAEIAGAPASLAFDHADILGLAIRRLRGKLDYSQAAFALLPETFTLRRLQDIYESIQGRRLNKPAFRRRMIDKGWIVATGQRESGASFRPAELYRRQNA